MNKHVMVDICHICSMYTNFIARQANLNSYGYELEDKTPCFGFIPSGNLIDTLNQLRIIGKRLRKKTGHSPKFIDIGCGIGNIVLLANAAHYEATGLEYDLETCKTAKHLCKRTNIKIIKGDMRTFKNYCKYDVLYFYQPMRDYHAMLTFTTELAKQMKPGAYLICNDLSESFENSKDFYQVGKKDLWRKKPIRNKRRN